MTAVNVTVHLPLALIDALLRSATRANTCR